MYNFLKISFVFLGFIIVVIALLVFSFTQSMKPDKDKEEAVKIQAEQYLKDNFNENFEVYDTLYDNMGNFEFEYAAKAQDKNSKTNFLIYYDDETNTMVDTYIEIKWAKELESEIQPFLRKNLEGKTDVYIIFENKVGRNLSIDPNDPNCYKDYDVEATIRLTIPRKKKTDDEKVFNEFVSFLKNEDKLQHGTVIVVYIAENGVVLVDDEWRKEF
ncbi:hypothetical protein DVB69_11580 [Sporosarcina sp. BI001-red]|uniref:hypothetical protein n=1 Tax=Sporosarcina sp. BI001-red TaxID=2282866 RepID=UPI000E26B0F7|nr:hypothetical protein [Sporosarcina sp. BI001-red]REB07459.1 hypothetical protein DVB69_11580 [Sporosarcina sp. BI001-red]